VSRSHLIRLQQSGPRLEVISLDETLAVPRPIVLPRLPLSLIRWCLALADLHWNQHRRCMGIFLLLEADTLRWHTIIPRQRCRKRQAQLSLRLPPDPLLTPQSLLAGSVQTACVSDLTSAVGCVPSMDGLHLIQERPRTAGRLQRTYVLVRMGDHVSLIHPNAYLIDDLAQTLREHAGRLGQVRPPRT
jgi:hypothetical protein